MKSTWFCYALDRAGILALCGAAAALASLHWSSGTPQEAASLLAFKYALTVSVASFLGARLYEIGRIMRSAPALAVEAPGSNARVESLSDRERLPRAA